jgi:diaminopimelate decarboxylase
MLNDSIQYIDEHLYCDRVAIEDITATTGTPVYIYCLRRSLQNLSRIRAAFAELNPHIHYSAKANANLALLRALTESGAGIDAVSAGEIHKALAAGARPEDIVFAGVGKTADELRYALEKGVGWINAENLSELRLINDYVAELKCPPARIALRLNPDIMAPTHHHIATGHKSAKFGLPIEAVRDILTQRAHYPYLNIQGIHIHIGSQLGDINATRQAVVRALELISPYPDVRTVNIGGGLAVAYSSGEKVPRWEEFAAAITPLLRGYNVLLEPGRSIIADAGMLIVSVLYLKEQGGQNILVTDGSMAELIRPALYEAHHEIVPVNLSHSADNEQRIYQIVGPVCESADLLGHDRALPEVKPGDLLAVLTAGAYGMVMASNYNQRLRPPEVVVSEDGASWKIARRRETWEDLLRYEVD